MKDIKGYEGLTYLIKDDIIKGEEWKDIANYERLYQVSNLGRVKSLPRKGTKGGIMTQHERKDGKFNKHYLRVALSKNHQTKWFSINRLVAEAFIQNPRGLPEVDHINNDERDNRVENLQWIDREKNIIKDQGRKVMCVETGEIFECMADACEWLGKSRRSGELSRVVDDKNKTAGGYHWQGV